MTRFFRTVKRLILPLVVGSGSGCAVLHHAQVGDIDNTKYPKTHLFDVKVSETGVNIDEVAGIGKAVAASRSDEIEQIRTIVSIFQQGPRTGNIVFNESYAENIGELIRHECPNGRITNLVSIREARKYPVISGEIIKVTGVCIDGEN